MKVLLTGSNGFVGQHVLSAFADQDVEVKVLVRNGGGSSKDIVGDLNDLGAIKDSIKEFAPEVLVHLAWEGIPDLGLDNSLKNLKNSIDLFNICVDAGVRKIVVAGSCFEYDKKEDKKNK